jgi:mono/diheme cytochrome c family protein
LKLVTKLLLAGLVTFALLQLVRPRIPAKSPDAEIQAPPEVKQVLVKHCYACHSDQPQLAWFDQVVPAYWLVRSDILTARQHLNFSTIGPRPPAAQKAALFESVNMVQMGAMPLPQFLAMHPEAKVSEQDLAILKTHLAPWAAAPESQPSAAASAAAPPVPLSDVKPEWNGLEFDAGFEDWLPISFTDRGDNNTFRFILGNNIAIKAAQSGTISPWPDGARFAKIAWQQQSGADGIVHSGTFVQVELMVKDATRYKSTEGWGWGRWRGLDLKPYGTDAKFVTECTSCHLPLRGNDYVYTQPITSAKVDRLEIVNNTAASLPANLPYQPLAWRAITMLVDRQSRTMATLYGNSIAMQAVHPRSEVAPSYPAGSVLAAVTWAQRDDPHWFGARIPDVPLSIEFVEISPGNRLPAYRRFAGAALVGDRLTAGTAASRTSFILGLTPAQLP